MVEVVKNKQFLTVMKTVQSRNETICIGIFDINKGTWCEEAPFIKQSMRGQSYPELLTILIKASDVYNPQWRTRLQLMDFCSSVLDVDINHLTFIGAEFSINELAMISNQIKKVKKFISKHREEIKANIKAFPQLIKNEIFSIDGELGKENFIQELYGYHKMASKVLGNSYEEENEFKEYYAKTVWEYQKRGYSNDNIMTAFRIFYFQGANTCFPLSEIFKYIDKVKALEIDMPTGNFLINFRQVNLAYIDKRDEIESKKFEKQQKERVLKFEKDNITMIVPTTREELKHYGNVFNNCLNGWEWENQLANGRRYVVIILQDNEPMVSCDIDRETMEIKQYYSHRNKNVHEASLVDFREDYQKYLYSLITK